MIGVKVITRADAVAAGVRRYFTGVPCAKAGHISERRTSDCKCIECRNESGKSYHDRTKDKHRIRTAQYRAKNSDKEKERLRQWRMKNTDKTRNSQQRWREENRETARNNDKAYRSRHPDRIRQKDNKRRALQCAAGGSHTAQDIEAIFARQKGRCAHSWCRVSIKLERHLDHITPLIRGGSNDRRNLQLLCPMCNPKKGAKDPIDWARRNGLLV